MNIPSAELLFRALHRSSPAMRDAAAERGARIHEACTAFDFDGEEAEVDGDIVGYVQAYANFLRDYSIKNWLLFETPMVSSGSRPFAGTIDRYGPIDGASTLVDIKSGSKIYKPVTRAQLAGYRELLLDKGYSVSRTAILHLRRDGTYGYHSSPADDAAATDAFFNCLKLHHYIEEGKAKCHK